MDGSSKLDIMVESKSACRWQLIVCGDYHVGNTSVGDDMTRGDENCVNIRFCLASILVKLLQLELSLQPESLVVQCTV